MCVCVCVCVLCVRVYVCSAKKMLQLPPSIGCIFPEIFNEDGCSMRAYVCVFFDMCLSVLLVHKNFFVYVFVDV